MNPETILRSDRLDLLSMSLAFLEACLEGDAEKAASAFGVRPPPEWLGRTDLMRLRLGQLRDDPVLQPWLLRAVVLRSEGRMIGNIGFHNAPGSADLREVAPGGVELGYTVYPEFRRRGYAFEACVCLMNWARRAHGVSRFVATISPENVPSLALARKLGFVKVGSQWDEEDGPEVVFLLEDEGT